MTGVFEYDELGNRTAQTDFNGHVTTYAYDELNRLLSKTPDASFNAAPITFTYYPNGQRKTMSDPSGTTSYVYDNRSRLQSKQTPFGTTTYSYEKVGNLAGFTYPNGVQHTYTYDDLNRLTNLSAAKSTTALASYAYTLGAAGNRTSVAELSGRTVSYGYDDLYQLGLSVKRTRRKRLRREVKPRLLLTAPNQEWRWTLSAT